MSLLNTITRLTLFTLLFLGLDLHGQAQTAEKLKDLLDTKMEELARKHDLKGVSAAMVFEDGSVWSNAYGSYGIMPLRTDMLFEMGSNTKTFTAVAILKLVEEGELSLSDTLYKFMEPIKNIDNGITVKQLLNHTSGIASFTAHPDYYKFINNNNDAWLPADSVLAKYVGKRDFKAGKGWEYSNTNYTLLGKIIEKVTGKAYHEVVREMLLEPNGLNDTYTATYETFDMDRAGTWLYSGEYFDSLMVSFLSSAGSAGAMVCTPEDLAQWAYKLYDGQLLSGESMQDFIRPTEVNGKTYMYGMGNMIRSRDDRLYLGHGGTTLQHSEMEFSPRSNFSCVTMCIDQAGQKGTKEIQHELIRLAEKEFDFALSSPEETSQPLKMQAYPNPSTSSMTISIPNSQSQGISSLTVYNSMGQQVLTKPVYANQVTIQRAEVGPGVFFIAGGVGGADKSASSWQRIIFK